MKCDVVLREYAGIGVAGSAGVARIVGIFTLIIPISQNARVQKPTRFVGEVNATGVHWVMTVPSFMKISNMIHPKNQSRNQSKNQSPKKRFLCLTRNQSNIHDQYFRTFAAIGCETPANTVLNASSFMGISSMKIRLQIPRSRHKRNAPHPHPDIPRHIGYSRSMII